MNNYNNNPQNIYTVLSQNVKNLMKANQMSQLSIVSFCQEHGLKLSQGTISNVLNSRGNITLDTISTLATVFDTDVIDLLTPQNSATYITPFSSDAFITNPDDVAFQGYLGTYELCFYKTSGKNTDLLHGTLIIDRSEDGKSCVASLTLPTGDTRMLDNQEVKIEKKYTGTLVISKIVHSAYVFLYNEQDISILVLHHWYILNNDLKCAMASAITTSSGSNRRPTTHRACIVRGKIPSEALPSIKGQLLLNDADMLISHTELNNLIVSKEIPASFKTLLKNATSKEYYRLIKENLLIDSSLFDEYENTRLISHVRSKSTAPRYNKISKRTDDSLFSLLFKNNKKENCK